MMEEKVVSFSKITFKYGKILLFSIFKNVKMSLIIDYFRN